MLKERVLRVGRPTPLVGVVTEPASVDPELPVVLILNSGVMHHVGACRLSVKIARAAAARGLLAVRFDYSGIGDSEPRRGSDAFEQVSIRECAEVMDYLEKNRGARRFILYGLCSGADASYNAALADPRVMAIAQIDAYCYVTPRYYFEYYWPLLLRGDRWKSFLGNHWRKLTGRAVRQSPSEVAGVDEQFFEVPTYTRIFPSREEVARGLTELVNRNVRIYVNFTGGEPHYNYPNQFRDSFRDVPFRDLLTVSYYPPTNHIITQPKYQAEVVANIAGWMERVARDAQADAVRRVA